MTEALFWALLAACGTVLALAGRRAHSRDRIIRRIYRHVDEPLGATRFENNRRASRRRVLAFFSLPLANAIYPTTQYGGTSALPSTGRMRRYVIPEYSHVPWPRVFRYWHVAAVELRWTSEANALGAGFGDLLARKTAQALVLASPSKLEQVPRFEEGYFRLERAQAPQAVPSSVPFDTDAVGTPEFWKAMGSE